MPSPPHHPIAQPLRRSRGARRSVWVAGLAALVLVGQVRGEELHRDWVPADAFWVAHLDVEAVGRSVLGRAAQGWGQSQPNVAQQLQAFEERYALHPLDDLFGLTLYGSAANPEDAVAIVVGSDSIDRLEAQVRAHPRHRHALVDGLDISTWEGQDLPLSETPLAWFGRLPAGGEHAVSGPQSADRVGRADAPGAEAGTTDNSRRVIVLAGRADLLLAAVALVRGGPGGLEAAEQPLLSADPGAGTTLYLEAGRGLPELLGRLPASNLARQARRLRVMLGEAEGRAWARIRIGTGNRSNARDVADVLRGGLKLLRLTLKEGGLAPELAGRIDQVRIQEKRGDVFVSFQGPAAQLALELAAALNRLPALQPPPESSAGPSSGTSPASPPPAKDPQDR